MKQKDIATSIEKRKIHLSRNEKIEHWLSLIFLSILLAFIGYPLRGFEAQDWSHWFWLILILAGFVLLLRHKLVSPNLEAYRSNLASEEFMLANEAAAIRNGWIVLVNTSDYFSAITQVGWQWDGIRITAILKGDKIYLNSMVNPSMRSNPFSFGVNQKNKAELILQYQAVMQGESVVEAAHAEIARKKEAFWHESEWTAKKILKRIVGYGLSMLFFALSILLIIEGGFQGLVYGAMILLVCGLYIYDDIKLLLEKKRKSKEADRFL